MLKKSKSGKKESPSIPPKSSANTEPVAPLARQNSESAEKQFAQARAEIKKMLSSGGGTTATADAPVTRIAVESEEDDTEEQREKEVAREESAATVKDFAALYKAPEGEHTDMTTIVRKDPNRRKKLIGLIIGILLILLAVSVAGFYVFVHSGDKFNEDNIVITPDTPTAISSGEQFTITLNIVNRGLVAINNVEVNLQPPAEFMFVSSDPQAVNEIKNAWQLGTIKGNAAKKVTIVGTVTGGKGSVESFTTVVTYRPANFNSDFTRSHSFSLTVTDSILSLDLSVPAKVVSGKTADYSIQYTNNGKDTLDRVRLIMTLPDDLSATDFNPAPTRDTTWEFNGLASGKSGTITFKGSVTGEEGSARELKVEVGSVDSKGDYHVQNEETSIIFVVNPQLLLTLSVNKATDDNTADFGEKLDYVLKYRNDSQSDIQNMSLVVEINGDVIDWDSLIMSTQGTRNNKQITWTSAEVPALKMVQAGAEGEILFSIAVQETITGQKPGDKNYSLVSKAKAISTQVSDMDGATLEVESNSLTTKLTSRLELRAEGRYYDDQFVAVGTGPLPPVVGQTTTYKIYWYVRNNANEVKDVTVTAKVPANATWMNDASVSAGNLSYDAASRTIAWSVNKIPPQVGQTIPELEAKFVISITPQTSDVATQPALLGESAIKAYDTFTEQDITKTQNAITTDLTNDPQAQGKGIVVASTASNANANSNSNTNSN